MKDERHKRPCEKRGQEGEGEEMVQGEGVSDGEREREKGWAGAMEGGGGGGCCDGPFIS